MLREAAWTDAINSARGHLSVSRDHATRTHQLASQVLTCPPAVPNYYPILVIRAL